MSDGTIPPAGRPAPQLPPQPLPAVQSAPVDSAPPELNQPQTIKGSVAESTKSQMTISTPRGDITVQTQVSLPVGTDVMLELRMQRAQLVANITVLKTQSAVQKEAAATLTQAPVLPPQNLPPLQTGASFTAIFVPNEAPLQATQNAPLPPLPPQTMDDLLQLLQILKPSFSELLKIPALPEAFRNLLNAPDIPALLKNMTGAEQKSFLAFLGRPEVTGAIKNFLPTASSVTPSDAPDSSLVHIIGSSLSSRVSPVTQGAASSPGMSPLQSLIPLLQNPADNSAAQGRQNPMKIAALQMPENIFKLTIGSVAAPGMAAPKAGAGQISGMIESITPRGFPVVQTENGFFVLQAPATADVGSKITMTAKPLDPVTFSALSADVLDSVPGGPWPALQETLDALKLLAPETAAALKGAIPTPASGQMTPQTLFFLAALRTGLVENWTGSRALDLLRMTGKKELIEKLGGDFARLSAQSKTETAGEWRMISMPVMHDEQIAQIQMFVRQQQDQESGDKTEEASAKPMTRFILNINLSRMGDIQLDGLMRKKQLDLILRTNDALPFSIRQELMQKYARGLAQVNYEGGITFQTKSQGWVTLPSKRS